MHRVCVRSQPSGEFHRCVCKEIADARTLLSSEARDRCVKQIRSAAVKVDVTLYTGNPEDCLFWDTTKTLTDEQLKKYMKKYEPLVVPPIAPRVWNSLAADLHVSSEQVQALRLPGGAQVPLEGSVRQ